jgi:hypothetical protein
MVQVVATKYAFASKVDMKKMRTEVLDVSSRVHQTVPSYTFFKRATFDDGFKCMGYGRLTIMRVYGFTFSSEQLDPDSGGTSKPPELLSNKR